MRVLVANQALKQKVAALRKGPQEFFQVDVGDGVKLNGWIIKPPDFNPEPQVSNSLHGVRRSGSQTVLDRWGGSTYLWHLMLAQKGIPGRERGQPRHRSAWPRLAQDHLPPDGRDRNPGSGQRGPRHRPVVLRGFDPYGNLGLELRRVHEPERHSSRHRTSTRMAIAVAPVTHWKFYDNIYTERYNGLPKDNKEGYDAGSPLTYVNQMKGGCSWSTAPGTTTCITRTPSLW